jgi:hypothetical protein
MIRVFKNNIERIVKNSCSFLESYFMFLNIVLRLYDQYKGRDS